MLFLCMLLCFYSHIENKEKRKDDDLTNTTHCVLNCEIIYVPPQTHQLQLR